MKRHIAVLNKTVKKNIPKNFRLLENNNGGWINLRYIDTETECEFLVNSYHPTPNKCLPSNELYVTFENVKKYPRISYKIKYDDVKDLEEKLKIILSTLELTIQSYIKGCTYLVNNIAMEFLADGINAEYDI